jgi:hypothetical protein
LTVRGVTPAASAEFVQRRPDCLVLIGRDLIARLAKRPVAEEIDFDALKYRRAVMVDGALVGDMPLQSHERNGAKQIESARHALAPGWLLLAGFELRPALIATKAQGAAGNAAPAPEPTPAPAPMPSVNPSSGVGLVRPGGSAWHGYVARVNSALIITPSLRTPHHRDLISSTCRLRECSRQRLGPTCAACAFRAFGCR